MRNPKSIIFGLILTACFLLGMASGAWAWWDKNWEYRRKIAFDTTAAGSDIKDNLSDIPILIRLHSGNFNFDNAKENGSDIRFLGEDDKTPLKYHFERFDSIDGIGLIWVSIPKLSGESNQNFVWMYYGNKSAVDAQDTKGSYDVNYALVYHLAEVEGAPKDATAFDNNSSQFTGGQGLPSLIGNGISLNGAGDRIVIPVSPSLDFSGGFTFSTWIRVHQAQEHAYLFSWEEGEQAVLIGIKGTRIYSDISAEKDRTFKTDKSVDLPLNSWQRLAVTVVPNGRLTVYLEGVEMYWMNVPSQMPKLKGNIYIGGSSGGKYFFKGDLDEIRISKTARSAPWIRAGFMAEGPEGKLVSVKDEDAGEGGGTSQDVVYLKTIVSNITLDGWIIIGSLFIFSIGCWLIFILKAIALFKMNKTNRKFLVFFSGLSSLRKEEDEDEDEDFYNSSLYRIYQAGKLEMMNRLKNPGDPDEEKKISRRALNSIKAAIEGAYIRESQKLHAWIVFLTMAIAGGPFLGLLGTVWGVMNTFAAMAVAGEANMTAIAPGVASALAATVFGLLVAIPALFEYNYLITNIKNISAEMALFADQLALKIEETEG